MFANRLHIANAVELRFLACAIKRRRSRRTTCDWGAPGPGRWVTIYATDGAYRARRSS